MGDYVGLGLGWGTRSLDYSSYEGPTCIASNYDRILTSWTPRRDPELKKGPLTFGKLKIGIVRLVSLAVQRQYLNMWQDCQEGPLTKLRRVCSGLSKVPRAFE